MSLRRELKKVATPEDVIAVIDKLILQVEDIDERLEKLESSKPADDEKPEKKKGVFSWD